MRLFVAVAPDPAVRHALAAAAFRLESALGPAASAFRFTSREKLHVTLRFLGSVDEARVPVLTRALAGAAADVAPFPLEFSGAGAFPSVRRPRVLWLGTGAGADELVALAARVELAVNACGFEPESRPFSPHLTVARSREPRRTRSAEEASARLAGAIAWLEVREIVLFRSAPAPGGVRYEPLATLPLSRPR